MRGLEGKSAIVTGGGSGIGRAIALRLEEEGCAVAIFDLDKAGADAVAAESGGKATAYQVDVTDGDAVEAAVAQVYEAGPVWLLVNCAGWDFPTPFLKTDRDLWRKIVDINLYGPMNLHHSVCGRMAETGGRVVNIASDAARVGTSGEAVYSACKAGLISLTKSLARELARNGILLNAVCPGPTDTPLMQTVVGSGEDGKKFLASMARGIPLRRIATPEDYPGLVAFLASDDAAYITGQTFSVSGGLTMI